MRGRKGEGERARGREREGERARARGREDEGERVWARGREGECEGHAATYNGELSRQYSRQLYALVSDPTPKEQGRGIMIHVSRCTTLHTRQLLRA